MATHGWCQCAVYRAAMLCLWAFCSLTLLQWLMYVVSVNLGWTFQELDGHLPPNLKVTKIGTRFLFVVYLSKRGASTTNFKLKTNICIYSTKSRVAVLLHQKRTVGTYGSSSVGPYWQCHKTIHWPITQMAVIRKSIHLVITTVDTFSNIYIHAPPLPHTHTAYTTVKSLNVDSLKCKTTPL